MIYLGKKSHAPTPRETAGLRKLLSQSQSAWERRGQDERAGGWQETLASLVLCRGPQGASHGGSEKSGKLEVGGASRDSTGFGALEEGLIFS